ncbi:ABC transporter permease [Luteipulveratus halotolerans]|uniref:Xylose transport system permease protein XylH n=1 Tax=Luteipulveratus halotolerans TaxID=1631356 RepID=A0A0L6CJM6_9MICO|nr:ABC transporter permease [Luteipulveratus halotolerans]KNX37820.1 ribose ABC transporter permease [Luteipulveratus halotolerans]
MGTSASTPAAAVDDRVAPRSGSVRLLRRPEIGALLGAVVVCVFFLIVASAFRNVDNVGTILYGAATIGIMAVPVALLMVGGEFDLSAGVAVTSAGLAASLLAWYFNFHVWFAVLLALLISLAIGAFNGTMLNRTGLPSFLVTLGTFFILQGVNLGMTKVVTGNVASNNISDMQGFESAQHVFAWEASIGSVAIKAPVVYWLVITVVAAVVLLKTRFGNWIFAVGGDADAARAVGVPVHLVRLVLYMFVGFCAWLAGMHLLFEFNTVQSGDGVGNEFIFIIAAVVGGCLLTGGYGSAVGASIGALIFAMTQLGINYAGWNPDWFKTFLGVMLVLATLVNLWVKKKADAR